MRKVYFLLLVVIACLIAPFVAHCQTPNHTGIELSIGQSWANGSQYNYKTGDVFNFGALHTFTDQNGKDCYKIGLSYVQRYYYTPTKKTKPSFLSFDFVKMRQGIDIMTAVRWQYGIGIYTSLHPLSGGMAFDSGATFEAGLSFKAFTFVLKYQQGLFDMIPENEGQQAFRGASIGIRTNLKNWQ